jgi:hypothetical protein
MSEIFEIIKTAFTMIGFLFICLLLIGIIVQSYTDRKK